MQRIRIKTRKTEAETEKTGRKKKLGKWSEEADGGKSHLGRLKYSENTAATIDDAAGSRAADPVPSPLACVIIIGNNANGPPPFFSQRPKFSGVTAHSTSRRTEQSAKRTEQTASRKPHIRNLKWESFHPIHNNQQSANFPPLITNLNQRPAYNKLQKGMVASTANRKPQTGMSIGSILLRFLKKLCVA